MNRVLIYLTALNLINYNKLVEELELIKDCNVKIKFLNSLSIDEAQKPFHYFLANALFKARRKAKRIIISTYKYENERAYRNVLIEDLSKI